MNDGLEDEVLELMQKAAKDAQKEALEIGPIMVSEQDEFGRNYIVLLDKFGNKQKIKEIAPWVKYPKGTVFSIKKKD